MRRESAKHMKLLGKKEASDEKFRHPLKSKSTAPTTATTASEWSALQQQIFASEQKVLDLSAFSADSF